MALIKWKQISEQLGDYGILSGSLNISGSILLNGANLAASGGVPQTLSVSGTDITISDGNTISIAGTTGSLINTASVSNNVITFTKGDGTSFSLTIDTGSGGGGATDISALNTFTGSIQGEVNTIKSVTGSYAVTSSNTFTGSQFFSGALIPEAYNSQNGKHDLGSLTNPWRDLYITTGSLNFVKDGTLVSVVSGEPDAIRIGNILITTSSIAVVSGSGDSLTVVQNVVSASISSSGEVENVEQITAPDGTVSSSAQITALGFISESSTGLVSSSTQITELGFVSNANTASFLVNSDTASFITNDDTGSFITNDDTGSFITSAVTASMTVLSASYAISSSHEIITEVSSSHAQNADTASFISDTFISASAVRSGFGSGGGSTSYDGNRIISNELLPSLFSASFNPGTSGSITDFLNAVFYPNSAPTITSTANINIAEFLDSGSSIHTITATDPEGQGITFQTASGYTDDLVRVSSGGSVTLNTGSTTELFNTVDRGDGTLAHEVGITATDTFGTAASQTLYFDVTANSAPVFRQTSVAGNIITSFTASRNENASTGEVAKIYFTDTNSDTITIRSSSVPGGDFTITKYGTYVSIAQATASLDYETTSSYSFSITASDEHYEASEDTDAVTTLPITISVTDNIHPTINNQTLTGVSESSAASTVAGNIAASDSESDTITFFNFTTSSRSLDGTPITAGTYGNTSSGSDPSENPFQMTSAGQVSLKSGHFLNSDIINQYKYTVQVRDSFNTASNTATITIPIADDAAPSISGLQAFYLIESAVSGASVYDSTNGYSGTVARLTSNQSVTWEISSSNDFAISSTGYITVARNISGSSTVGGNTINGSVTASNSFGTSTANTFTVNITDNVGPTVSTATNTNFFNTNGARSGSYLYTFTFSDSEGNAIDTGSFTWNSDTFLSASIISNNTARAYVTGSIPAGTYRYTGSIADEHGFETTTFQNEFTINQAPIGSLTGNTTSHIIESAISGAVLRSLTGYNAGVAADLGVSYSPQYNSAAVQSFTSSNAAIAVNNSGNLTLAVNLSGSATSSGDTISSDITFRDQYDNVGSGSITVNVFGNSAPTATFANQTANLTASVSSGDYLVGVTISDTESDTPFSMSISGLSGSSFTAVPQNSNSSSYQIQASGTLSEGTYPYSASIFDNFDEQTNYNRTLTIAAPPVHWYAYIIEGGAYATNEATSLQMLGDNSDDGSPDANTALAGFVSGSIGNGTFTFSAFSGIDAQIDTAFEIASGSSLEGSRTSTIIDAVDHTTGSEASPTNMLAIVFPSGSGFTLPDSTTTSLGGSTAGEYVLYADRVGTGINDAVQTAFVRYFDLSGSVTYPDTNLTRFGVLFTQGDGSNDVNYFFMASSGSAPSSTQ